MQEDSDTTQWAFHTEWERASDWECLGAFEVKKYGGSTMVGMRLKLPIVSLVAFIGTANAQPDTSIGKVVAALGSPDFKSREKAMRDLAGLEEVPDVLWEATRSRDAETRKRAEAAVKIIADRLGEKAFLASVSDTMVTDLRNAEMDRLIRHLVKGRKAGAKDLANYGIGDNETATKDRERWQAGKERYAKAFPLRAAVFEAAVELAAIRALKIPLTLDATSAAKSAMIELQPVIAKSAFNLEQFLVRMKEASASVPKETSLRWQADFDFALTRVEANLIFLFECNYLVGQVRAAQMPDLRAGENGWKILRLQGLTVSEKKPKTLASDRRKLLARIQEVHVDTPWAYFAERESRRDLGMKWVARQQ